MDRTEKDGGVEKATTPRETNSLVTTTICQVSESIGREAIHRQTHRLSHTSIQENRK